MWLIRRDQTFVKTLAERPPKAEWHICSLVLPANGRAVPKFIYLNQVIFEMSHNIITPDRSTTVSRLVQVGNLLNSARQAWNYGQQVGRAIEPYRERVRELVRSTNRNMPRRRKRSSAYRRRQFRRKYRKFTGGRGITKEHDRTNIYRKKSMPRFKKRRWRRFSKKVYAVSEKEMGTQTVVYNDQKEDEDFLNTDPSVTGSATLALYSFNGNAPLYKDLAVMMNDLHQGAPTVASGTTKYRSTKVIFKSAVFDLTLTNTSYDRIGSVNNINANYTLEVDVHVVTMKKPMSYLSTVQVLSPAYPTPPISFPQVVKETLTTIDDCVAYAEADIKKIGGDDSKIFDVSKKKFNRGGTLWDTPQALSLFGMKILSKKKYFIPGGQTMTYQMRDAKRRVMMQDWNGIGSNKPGWTKFLYITYKLCPGVGVMGEAELFQIRTRLSVGVTRKYSYKIEGVNDIRDNYNPVTS